MARYGTPTLAFPPFRGITRTLVVAHIIAYFFRFAFGLFQGQGPGPSIARFDALFTQSGYAVLHLHYLWQPLTYSFVHAAPMSTAFELLSLWFLCGFLEDMHGSQFVLGIYASAVLGTALTALALYAIADKLGPSSLGAPLYGCFGAIFGLLVAIGILHGDMEFLVLFVINMKARYLAVVYALISIAMLFGSMRIYAFAQLGGALAGWLYLRSVPRRQPTYGSSGYGASGLNAPARAASEFWFGLRNRYYRWKRRRAAKKFEVYMKEQGRTVRLDGQGKRLDDDPNDRSKWN